MKCSDVKSTRASAKQGAVGSRRCTCKVSSDKAVLVYEPAGQVEMPAWHTPPADQSEGLLE